MIMSLRNKTVYRVEKEKGAVANWEWHAKFVIEPPWLFYWCFLRGTVVVKIRTDEFHIARFLGRPHEVLCDNGKVEWEREITLELGRELVRDGCDPYVVVDGPDLLVRTPRLPLDWLQAWREEYDVLPLEVHAALMEKLRPHKLCPMCASIFEEDEPCQIK